MQETGFLRVAVLIVLGACGPISLAEAERQCFERARLAEQPGARSPSG